MTVTNPPLQCPKCNSVNLQYLGIEDTEVYECRDCGELFGHVDESHT